MWMPRHPCNDFFARSALTWAVGDDVESEVRALKAKGLTFEHYDNARHDTLTTH